MDQGWALPELIEELRDVSYRQLAERIEAIGLDQARAGLAPITKLHTSTIQQMVTLPRLTFISPDSMVSLAAGLRTSVRAVVLANARSLDLNVSGPDDDVLARLDPRLSLLGPNQWRPFRAAQEEWVRDAERERALIALRAEVEQLRAEIKDARKGKASKPASSAVFRSAD